MLHKPHLTPFRDYTYFFTDEIGVTGIKLSDKQAVDFPNEAEQVLRVFILYSIERLSGQTDAA